MLKQRKIWALALAILMLLTAAPALAVSTDEPFSLGNTPGNSLHGGIMAEYGGTLFWADHTGIYAADRLLTEEPGRHLNVIGGGLYFTVTTNGHTALRRFDLDTEATATVFTWDAPIDQLLVASGGMALFLSEGRVHRLDKRFGNVSTDETEFAVTRFIPTAYGTIYATGSLGDFTLYAGDRLIEAEVTLFFTEGDYLIVRRGTVDYEAPFAALFSRAYTPIVFMAYQPRVYEAEALSTLAALAEDEPESAPADDRPSDNFPINILPAQTTYTLALTQNQINIVRRARQQLEIRWTPLQDIYGWRGNTVFRAGETYIGIPYGQPIHAGRYVPWGASFERFMNAVQDSNSVMYTSFSFNGTDATRAPFYSSDCSSFVSWSLNQPRRTTTWSFPTYATRITRELSALQVGDVLNSTGHNILVSAVEFDAEGNLAAIETMEQTVPLPSHRRYGVGGTHGGLANLMNRMNATNYHFYRSNITHVPFTPTTAVNVEGGARHHITAIVGPGGVMSPGAGLVPVPAGYDQRFVFRPNRGFAVSRVLIDGVDVGPMAEYTFRGVTAAARIEVEFELVGSPFVDVVEGDWFYDAVVYVFSEGLMNGTSSTAFSPQATTTRGMFVTILGRMAGVRPQDHARPGLVTGTIVNVRSGPGTGHAILAQVNRNDIVNIIGQSGDWFRIHHGNRTAYITTEFVQAQSGTFSDVTPGAFYAPYVEWAYAQDITSGTGGGRFSPGATMTRQEMATLLYRYTQAMDISLATHNVTPFGDIGAVAIWARPAVEALQRAQVVSGAGGNFSPHGNSARSEVAQMIANFHQLHG